MKSVLIDHTGQTFSELKVICRAKNPYGGKTAFWRCKCSCGEVRLVSGAALRRGGNKSCGHMIPIRAAIRLRTHGMTKTPIYATWKAMRQRCANPKRIHYHQKGISVCKEWDDFTAFQKWAIKSGYSLGLTIERKNNSLGYTPDNCTWIPHARQADNRSNVAMSPEGRPWWHIAKENGITRAAYQSRLNDGWPHKDAATRIMFMRHATPSVAAIIKIRELKVAGERTADVAKKMNTSKMTVIRIANGSRWAHIK